MIDLSDLLPCIGESWFVVSYGKLERNLLLARLGMSVEPLDIAERNNLARFSQAVMAGDSCWADIESPEARKLCQIAGDIEAAFANSGSPDESHLSLIKAMVLYDLAGLAGTSSSYAAKNGFDPRFRAFFA